MEGNSEQLPSVNFLNVAHIYVPNTKVECHYNLPVGMKASTHDWIGIFKVGAASIRDYNTFVWASSPQISGDGSSSHYSVQFQAYYLPPPGEQQYQFQYVTRHGIVRGCSEPFVFGEPRPMEDLVTLEDEEASLGMLLVVPKATLLQHQLEESQQERNDLMRVRLALEEEVSSLQKQIKDLEASLETSDKKCSILNQQCQDASMREQIMKEEGDLLSCKEAEHQARILVLESDIQDLNQKIGEKDKEISTWGTQNSCLEAEKEKLKQRLAVSISEKERYQLQVDKLQEKLRCTLDILSSSQQKVILLGEELATVSSIRDRTIADLHKSRLETADLAIKVSDLSMRYKEGLGQWWQEKITLNHSMEAKRDQIMNLKAERMSLESSLHDERSQRQTLQCKMNQEKDASQVQLSESRRELSELKSALKVAQMEKEQLKEERQEMLQYVHRLEERLDKLADDKWKDDKMLEEDTETGLSPPSSPAVLSDLEEETPEKKRVPDSCTSSEEQCSPTQLVFPRETHKVVISQPAPIACQLQPLPEDSPDSKKKKQSGTMEAEIDRILADMRAAALVKGPGWLQGRLECPGAAAEVATSSSMRPSRRVRPPRRLSPGDADLPGPSGLQAARGPSKAPLRMAGAGSHPGERLMPAATRVGRNRKSTAAGKDAPEVTSGRVAVAQLDAPAGRPTGRRSGRSRPSGPNPTEPMPNAGGRGGSIKGSGRPDGAAVDAIQHQVSRPSKGGGAGGPDHTARPPVANRAAHTSARPHGMLGGQSQATSRSSTPDIYADNRRAPTSLGAAQWRSSERGSVSSGGSSPLTPRQRSVSPLLFSPPPSPARSTSPVVREGSPIEVDGGESSGEGGQQPSRYGGAVQQYRGRDGRSRASRASPKAARRAGGRNIRQGVRSRCRSRRRVRSPERGTSSPADASPQPRRGVPCRPRVNARWEGSPSSNRYDSPVPSHCSLFSRRSQDLEQQRAGTAPETRGRGGPGTALDKRRSTLGGTPSARSTGPSDQQAL
ncbi:calcium-binding and coiled-coil domain-containing protein 1 [Pelodytes ibericus]